MRRTSLPTPERLRQLLRYEPETGKLYWLPRSVEMFKSLRAANSWNARFAGKEALTARRDGYRVGHVDSHLVPAHRVIWALVHGYWPERDIDHRSGIRDHNRIGNLREATRSENMCNRAIPDANTSGHVGVFFHAKSGKWRAHIKKNGLARHLGCFNTLEAALAARKSAVLRYHGDFARAA